MYIDLETGTIVNGPIVHVPDTTDFDDLSDSEIVELAKEIGVPVATDEAEAEDLRLIRKYDGN